MLRQICDKIDLLNNYCIAKSTIIPQMKETCFEIFLTLFTLFSSIVKVVRSGSHYSVNGMSYYCASLRDESANFHPKEASNGSRLNDSPRLSSRIWTMQSLGLKECLNPRESSQTWIRSRDS